METYIKILFDVLKPIKENYKLLVSSPDQDRRIQDLKDNCSLTIFSAFMGTSLNFSRIMKDRIFAYQIYWDNRVKYFKENKKILITLLQDIISIIHQRDKMRIIDIRLNKETKQIKLLIENESIEVIR